MLFRFFFFQAEDGIRDLVRSRGLGDVYKRQVENLHGGALDQREVGAGQQDVQAREPRDHAPAVPVSYTHLTLPTSDLV